MLIHASSVAIEGKGVLIAGPPGVGKSDLALRLIDSGAELIADDQTELRIENDVLFAIAPASITGLFEIRHAGLVKMPAATKAPVALYVELAAPQEQLERLPEAGSIHFLDRAIRRLRLPAFAASTPAKIRAVLLYPMVSDRT